MSQFLLYLKIEPYLAQWFAHEYENISPIVLRRGSSESDILERYLTTRTGKRIDEVPASEANVVIAIPSFKSKDTRYYNYLPPHARKALERNIYVRFRCEMWKDLYTLDNVDCPISDLVWAWMEAHGIEDDPKHWEAIRQMYYRKRKAHYAKLAQNSNTEN